MPNIHYIYPDDQENLFSPIMQALLDPLLDRCLLWANEFKDETLKSKFLVVCYQNILSMLILF